MKVFVKRPFNADVGWDSAHVAEAGRSDVTRAIAGTGKSKVCSSNMT